MPEDELELQRRREEEIQVQQQEEPLEQQMEPLERMQQQAPEEMEEAQQEPLAHAEPQRVQANAAGKSKNKYPEEQAALAREIRRRAAQGADDRTVFVDKVRHGFYTAVKGGVTAWKRMTRQDRAQRNTRTNTQYMQSLQMAYDEIYAKHLQALEDGTWDDFNSAYGRYFREIRDKYWAAKDDVRAEIRAQGGDEQAYRQRMAEVLQERQVPMQFGVRRRANVVGGTKPAAMQYAEDGSKWLVKESVSCIGIRDPGSALVTEAGYKVQRLVNPETAIEAFRGQSVGRGIVSYQRIVQGVKQDDVDLFRFSRTPDALTEQELRRVEELSPQLLREHTSDWLLCNFDTKGENFIIANDGTGADRVYGIDKEASFRPILDQGAQKMSKDYCRFDQNTVYNRLFQKFSDGSMNLDLQQVLPQIERVEAMTDQEYMDIFRDFLNQKQREYARKPETFRQLRENILKRKQNLRMEYREFFTKLVEERCAHVDEAEAAALKRRYFGSEDGGTFIFAGETVEVLQAERARRVQMREENHEELEARARQADQADERSYARRHAGYDFSKSIVMGVKSVLNKFKQQQPEQRTTRIPLSQVRADGQNANPAFLEQCQRRSRELWVQAAQTAQSQQEAEQEFRRLLDQEMVELPMVSDHEIHLGGTKPMSEYIGADGSQWLAKQAVNCMGYFKLEGALLTEAGAKLQAIVDRETAVDAFVGRTKKHGEVSFQRRLQNVEHGEGKLDLFRFSRHPEIATAETIAAVQELSPQILREHTTDWLLCNFDTKGENFIITLDEQGRRVLHGIDKEAAFNKILDPRAQQMSMDYRPHANDTLYNVVFRMYANNEMDLDLFAVLPQIEKIEAIQEDEAYLDTFRGYLNHMQQKKPDKYEQIRRNILMRKQNLREDYCGFFTQLVLERCKKLHPDEAAALKMRYFGPGGARFRFPAANG